MKREDKTDPTLTNQPYNGTGNENFSWDNTMIRLTHPVWVSVTPKPKEARISRLLQASRIAATFRF